MDTISFKFIFVSVIVITVMNNLLGTGICRDHTILQHLFFLLRFCFATQNIYFICAHFLRLLTVTLHVTVMLRCSFVAAEQ